MQKKIALLTLAWSLLSGAEPRFLTEVEEVRPLLQQHGRDPFRYPGIWSLDAKDPFALDLKAMAEPVASISPHPVVPNEPTLGGMRPPTQNFLRKTSG
jgi:hypothetical protein